MLGGCSQRVCPDDADGAMADTVVRMRAGLFRRIVLPAMFRHSAHRRAVVVMRRHREQRQIERGYCNKKYGQYAFHFLKNRCKDNKNLRIYRFTDLQIWLTPEE